MKDDSIFLFDLTKWKEIIYCKVIGYKSVMATYKLYLIKYSIIMPDWNTIIVQYLKHSNTSNCYNKIEMKKGLF